MLAHNVRAATRRASGSYEVAGRSMTCSCQFSAVRSVAKLRPGTDGVAARTFAAMRSAA